MEHAINSPFRYAGGKFYARKLILEYVPEHFCYIEPFVGGGSIFFAKEKVEKNFLYDLDSDLINTFIHIRDYPNELIDALKGEKASKKRHSYFKNEYKPQNDFERALRWYYLNRTSFSGIMNMKNCYWGYGDKYSMRPENWGNSILNTSEKLTGVDLSVLDFEEVINQAPDNAFLFVDPPYYNADQDKFYTHCFNLEDHTRLRNILYENRNRIRFMLTYDNSDEVLELYDWAKEIHEKEWNYTINRTDDQKKAKNINPPQKGSRTKGREVFILNFKESVPVNKQLLIEY